MRKFVVILVTILITLGLGFFGFKQTAISPKNTETNKSISGKAASPSFDKSKLSITDPSSIWVVVNKSRPLNPLEFTPSDLITPSVPLRLSGNTEEMKLRKEPALALEKMVADAKAQGVNLKLASGYRSYISQITIYNNEVKQYGKAVADSESARPGHSEHQSGLAADLQDINGKCVVADCFKDLPEGKWLADHAWEYGFIIRYLTGKETITGYRYEPWHVRYIGVELSTEMHKTNVTTLEEFFNIVDKQPY